MAPKRKAGAGGGSGKSSSAAHAAASPDDLSPEEAQQLLLEDTQGGLPLEKLLWLAKASVPPCDGTCKSNTKGNPGCFCGWVPAPTSFKKKGLWQKEPTVLTQLGSDPNLAKREVRPNAA